MKKVLGVILFLGIWSIMSADGAALYKQCITCHGEKGEKAALGKSKVINAMSEADIIASMKGYKDGTYGGALKAVMVKQAASYDDAQIAEVAAYIIQNK